MWSPSPQQIKSRKLEGGQGRREERLVVITLTAVRNDGKQPDIKGADTNELLKSSRRISKISHLYRVKQHGTSVTALKARTMCKEERDLGPVSISQLLLEITWGDCLSYRAGPWP